MITTAGNFLRSLRGQLVSALLALLLVLLGLFGAATAIVRVAAIDPLAALGGQR